MQVLQDFEQGPKKPRHGFGGFIAELRRRHVVKAAIAYAAVAFAGLQAVQIIQQAWTFPDWVFRLIVVFTLLAFPLILALAWVYEITPQGVRSTRALEGHVGARAAGFLPRFALLAVTALVVGGSGWWWVRSTVATEGLALGGAGFLGAGGDPDDGISSLAVLPFDSYSDQAEGDFFAQGMHEALISQLSQLDFVRVISRTSAEQYDKTGKSVPQIGSDLGVDALVEGSVLRAEGKVRITVQLIDAANDRHLWAADYERDLVDIIALQREVAQAIAQEIRGELQPDAAAAAMSAAAPVSSDTVAMDEVMRGRQVLAAVTGPNVSPSVLDSAAAHFQRAIGEDPDYARAHSGMAQVHLMRGLLGGIPSAEEIRAAVQSAQRAFSLAPEDREVREVMASVETVTPDMPPGPSDATALLPPPPPPTPAEPAAPRGRGEAESAAPSPARGRAGGDSIRRVVMRGQDSPMMTRTESGRQIQIAIAQREARSGDPNNLFRAAQRLSTLDLYDEAADLLEDVLEEQPRNMMAWDELERIRRVQGDVRAVWELWRDRLEGSSSGSSRGPSLEDLERAVQRDGAQGYWQWRLDELEARRERGTTAPNLELAIVHAGLGHADQAFDFLDRAARGGDQRLRSVRTDPVWDPYRDDPRFMRILSEADEVRAPQGGQNRGAPPSAGNQGQRGNQGGPGNTEQRGNQGSGNTGRRGSGQGSGRPQGPPVP